MKNLILTGFLLMSLAVTLPAQTIRDDGKITKREKRFVTRKVYGSERAIRLQEWKDSRRDKKVQAQQRKQNRKTFRTARANKKNWGTRNSRQEHAKHYKSMKQGWFARTNPKGYVKETKYP